MRYDYEPVLIPTGTVEERISFLLNEVKKD
jgi:predicted ATPase